MPLKRAALMRVTCCMKLPRIKCQHLRGAAGGGFDETASLIVVTERKNEKFFTCLAPGNLTTATANETTESLGHDALQPPRVSVVASGLNNSNLMGKSVKWPFKASFI